MKVWFQNRRNKWKRDMAFEAERARFTSFPAFSQYNMQSWLNYFTDETNEESNNVPQEETFPKEKYSDCCYGNTALLTQPNGLNSQFVISYP